MAQHRNRSTGDRHDQPDHPAEVHRRRRHHRLAQIGDYQIVDFAKDAVFVGVGIEVSMWIIDKVFGK
jgi:hypothetical protein